MSRALCIVVALIGLFVCSVAHAQPSEEGLDTEQSNGPTWKKSPLCHDDNPKCVCRQLVKSKWKRRALRIKHVFFSCNNKLAWSPAVLYRSDFGLSYGVRAFHKNLFGADENVRFRLLFQKGQVQSYGILGGAPKLDNGRYYLIARASFLDIGNLIFSGLGNPDATTDGTGLDPRDAAIITRYKKTQIRTSTGVGRNFFDSRLRVGPVFIYERQRFGEISSDTGGRSIGEVYDTSRLPGFDDGVDLVQVLAEVLFDGRDVRNLYGAGWQGRLFAGGAPPFGRYSFFRYGSEAAYSVRLGRYHIVTAAMLHEALFGEQERIPFASEPRLGGVNLLRGYADGTFRDNLALVGVLQYRFPLIGRRLTGSVFVDAGKVGKTYTEMLGLKQLADHWQPSTGVALSIELTPEIRIQVSATRGDNFKLRLFTSFSPRTRKRGYFPRY